MLLPACVSGLQQEERRVSNNVLVPFCIGLEPPPDTIVDALEEAASKDEEASIWVIALEKHYMAIDKCFDKR